MMIGSIGAYTKNLKLQMQWDLKQRNGDYSSHKSLSEWLKASQEEERPGSSDDKLKSIQQKIFNGTKLTSEERRYLQAKDPETYAKLEANERDQKAFEQKLKQCKTKEEVQRLKLTYINTSLTIVRSVEHNPNIGVAKKLEIMMQEKHRCDLLEESHQEFIRRGEYGKLPTEAEQAKARKEEAEQREPEKVQDQEQVEKKPVPEEEKKADEAPERPVGKEEHRPEREEKPAIEVESLEMRKVRRARAKAAYSSASEQVGVGVISSLNLEA